MSNPHQLTEEQRRALFTEASNFDAALGEDFAVACNIAPADHVHVQRVGLPTEDHSRVGVSLHQGKALTSVLIHPAEARQLAAVLLNLADELDGTKPLVFFPRGIEGDLDDPRTKA